MSQDEHPALLACCGRLNKLIIDRGYKGYEFFILLSRSENNSARGFLFSPYQETPIYVFEYSQKQEISSDDMRFAMFDFYEERLRNLGYISNV